MLTLLFVVSVFVLVYGVIAREIQAQRRFEERAWTEWCIMTEAERLASGRETYLC